MTSTVSATRHNTSAHSRAQRVSFARVLRSEWIKLRSLRSTVWSFAIVVAVSLGLAFLMALSFGSFGGPVPADEQAKLVVQASTFGAFFGQLVMAVLGVLVISGEYSTGMIRSTLTAVPRRLPALWAKAVILFFSSFVIGLVSSFGAFGIAAPILAGKGIGADITQATVFMPLIADAFYLAVVAVFALGLGTIIRSSAGGIAAALGAILLLPIALVIPPIQWMHDTLPYLIMNAGLATFGLNAFGGPGPLETWQQVLVIIGWAVVALVTGAVLLKRRDA